MQNWKWGWNENEIAWINTWRTYAFGSFVPTNLILIHTSVLRMNNIALLNTKKNYELVLVNETISLLVVNQPNFMHFMEAYITLNEVLIFCVLWHTAELKDWDVIWSMKKVICECRFCITCSHLTAVEYWRKRQGAFPLCNAEKQKNKMEQLSSIICFYLCNTVKTLMSETEQKVRYIIIKKFLEEILN